MYTMNFLVNFKFWDCTFVYLEEFLHVYILFYFAG